MKSFSSQLQDEYCAFEALSNTGHIRDVEGEAKNGDGDGATLAGDLAVVETDINFLWVKAVPELQMIHTHTSIAQTCSRFQRMFAFPT